MPRAVRLAIRDPRLPSAAGPPGLLPARVLVDISWYDESEDHLVFHLVHGEKWRDAFMCATRGLMLHVQAVSPTMSLGMQGSGNNQKDCYFYGCVHVDRFFYEVVLQPSHHVRPPDGTRARVSRARAGPRPMRSDAALRHFERLALQMRSKSVSASLCQGVDESGGVLPPIKEQDADDPCPTPVVLRTPQTQDRWRVQE